jgi:hypothetical protein
MKTISRGLAALLLLSMLACAGKPVVNFSYDQSASFAGLKTYAWYDDPNFQMPGGFSVVDGQFVDRHVREDIEAELASRGYVKSTTGEADIYVSYATNPAGVVSQDKFGRYGWWQPIQTTGTRYGKEGSLVIDIRNRDHRLVWRGYKQAILGSSPEAIARDIEHGVKDLLGKFPPKEPAQ